MEHHKNAAVGHRRRSSSRRKSIVDILSLLTQPIETFQGGGSNGSLFFLNDSDPLLTPTVPIKLPIEPHSDVCGFNNNNNNNASKNYYSCLQLEKTINLDQLQPYDVVCGRNSSAFNHVGNRRFRFSMMMNLQRYMDAPTREEKTKIINSLVRFLQDDVGCRFLTKVDSSTYATMTNKQIREKVGHSLRDLVSANRRKKNSNIKIKSKKSKSSE